MTAIVRFLVAAAMVVATVAAFLAGERTGNYWGVVIVLVAATGFWLLEVPSRRGAALYAFQYLLVRFLSALIVVLLGATLIYLGVSELSSPVMFSRALLNISARIIREFAGSIGLATFLCVLGVSIIVQGLRLFPGGKQGASRG